MIRYFLQSIQREFKSSPKLLITFAAIAGVGVITLGVVVISMVWTPAPPDAANDDIKEIANFMKTDEFNELSAGQQRRYVKALSNRMDKMNGQDRKETHKLFREVQKSNPKAAQSLHVGYATHKFTALQGKTPEQERAKIRATLAVMEAVKGRRGMKQDYGKLIGETPNQRKKVIRGALKSVPDAYKATSIQERKKMFRTVRTLSQELESRYGD